MPSLVRTRGPCSHHDDGADNNDHMISTCSGAPGCSLPPATLMDRSAWLHITPFETRAEEPLEGDHPLCKAC